MIAAGSAALASSGPQCQHTAVRAGPRAMPVGAWLEGKACCGDANT